MMWFYTSLCPGLGGFLAWSALGFCVLRCGIILCPLRRENGQDSGDKARMGGQQEPSCVMGNVFGRTPDSGYLKHHPWDRSAHHRPRQALSGTVLRIPQAVITVHGVSGDRTKENGSERIPKDLYGGSSHMWNSPELAAITSRV